MPGVSAVSGERPARLVSVTAASRPWWPWLLLLAGPLGVLLLVVLYERMREHAEVWVPLSDGDLHRSRARARRAGLTFVASAGLVALGVTWVALAPEVAREVGDARNVAIIVSGLIACGATMVGTRQPGPMRPILRSGGQEVVLQDVAVELVDEMDQCFG